MLKNLFSSEVRIKLLTQFLMHPDQEFYLRGLSNKLHLAPNPVNRELNNLASIELIQKRISGNQHLYSVNQQHPLFGDLRNIFLKTVGLKQIIQRHLMPFSEQIDYCFVYGSFAKDNATAKSDLDLMVIGDISSRVLSGPLLQAGQELEREINYSVFILKEVEERFRSNDHFFSTIFHESKIFILGDAGEFERLGKEWLAETA